MAGEDDRRREGRDSRRSHDEKKDQTAGRKRRSEQGSPDPRPEETGRDDLQGDAQEAVPEGPSKTGEGGEASLGAAEDTVSVDAASDGVSFEEGPSSGDDPELPEGFVEPNKESGYDFSQRDDLPREANIHVADYDQFLAGHGGVPGQQEADRKAEEDKQAAKAEQDQAEAQADAEGWSPLEWEPGLWGAEESTQGADEEEEDDLRHHRFGLRLGRHQSGNFISKLKARFGKQEAESEDDLRASEEHEAAEERIEPNERYKEIETYPIRPPYGSIRILFDDDTKEYIYQPMEPVLTRTERDILRFIEESLVDSLTVSPEELEGMDDREFITERFNDVIFDYSIILHEDEEEEDEIKRKLLYYVLRDFIGHGRIDLVMEDPYIEDISCDGPKIPVFLYHRKYESMRSTVFYPDHQELDSFVIKMAQRSGKHISIAEPILDATLPDGSRLQSTLGKEVSAGGSTFTIRKFRPDPFTPPDLVLFRTMSAEMLAYLWIAVQHSSSVLYAGGTASGKTTSLNAILLFIPPQMKIVTIEDTREVNLPHENWIAGITRHGFGPRDQFGRQAGEIDMFQLLKNALRQRPEYIIVGEVRGHEAYSLFQAMATGHAAYGTMHADSVDAVIHRLESDPINVPRNLLEALDVVSVQIQTRVGGKRVRRTKQISEIVGIDPHTKEILTNEVFRWVPKDDSFKFSGISYILERIQLEKALPEGSMVRELSRRAAIIDWMIQKRIQDYREVSRIVSAYYREPEIVMGIVEGNLTGEEIPQGLREIANRTSQESDANPLSAAALEGAKVSMDPEDAKESAPESEAPALQAPEESSSGDEEAQPERPLEPEPAAASASPAPGAPESGSSKAEEETHQDSAKRPARKRSPQPDPADLLQPAAEKRGWGAGSDMDKPAKDAPGHNKDAGEDADPEDQPPSPVGLWGGAPGLLDAAKSHWDAQQELSRRAQESPGKAEDAQEALADGKGPEPKAKESQPESSSAPGPEPKAKAKAKESKPEPSSAPGPEPKAKAKPEAMESRPEPSSASRSKAKAKANPKSGSRSRSKVESKGSAPEGPAGSRKASTGPGKPSSAATSQKRPRGSPESRLQGRKRKPASSRRSSAATDIDHLHEMVDQHLAARARQVPPKGWTPSKAEAWLSKKEKQARDERHALRKSRRGKAKGGGASKEKADHDAGRQGEAK